jgi:hypothetical protein
MQPSVAVSAARSRDLLATRNGPPLPHRRTNLKTLSDWQPVLLSGLDVETP